MRQLGPTVATGLALGLLINFSAATQAAGEPSPEITAVMDTVAVTATRFRLPVQDLPEVVTLIQGADLRRRGVTDLRTAVALVPGVEAVPGGDGGPAAAVPALWGLREFDAFLLVVDGIPWGGAFIPDLPTLDLTDVERIEVLRGPAPITYGSTSFVGVIHVIHNRAGAGAGSVEIGGGSFGTLRGAAAVDIGASGRLAVDGAMVRLSDDDAGIDRGHARYRMELPHGISVWADGSVVNQDPASPHPRAGKVLDPAVPLDSNHNPSDARLDRTRLQLSASQSTRIVDWTAAVSHVKDSNTRGFLAPEAADDGSTPNASGYTQDRTFTELYAEAHRRFQPAPQFGVVCGGDYLFGKGEETSRNFTYYAPFDGSPRTPASEGTTRENTEFEAERSFLGLFGEVDWHPTPRLTALAGVRLNSIEEDRDGEAENEEGEEVPAKATMSKERLGARVGVNYRAWEAGLDRISLFADVRDTFKPAAIDFGPEAEVNPLKPETARSGQFGVRGSLWRRRFDFEVSAFRMDFKNLVVSTVVDGNPALVNAGTERFDGVELEIGCELAAHWRGSMTGAWHDAKFRDYVQSFDGVPTQLSGKRLEMSPKQLGSVGLGYVGPRGHAEATLNAIGERFLNKRNTAIAESYVTIDASAGTRLGQVDLRLTGRNLTDRRDPVAESELGDAQYYRLPARSVEVSVGYRL